MKSLGSWPVVGLKEARNKAIDFRKTLAKGDINKVLSVTFNSLAGEWIKNFLESYSPKEARRKKVFLDKFILPYIGQLEINTMAPKIILNQILKPLEKKGTLETVRKVKSLINLIYSYGVANGDAENNPTKDIEGALKPMKVTHRASIIEPVKVGNLLVSMRSYEGRPSVYYALQIIPYVFVRPGEMRNAEWVEIDLET
jgi:integrase